MDEPETKTCTNCKREIPAVNFTIHTVHCARNIKMCPVCKEPVPQQELQEHHEKLHKLLPCKKCGEQVCGTDLEDHVRDSCAHTVKSCRYCSLELPRAELPTHEGYCGARTEQCACGEWVMIKHLQMHLDSGHGAVRDPEPTPQPKKEPVKSTRIPKASNNGLWVNLNGPSTSSNNGLVKNTNLERPRTIIRPISSSSSADPLPGASGASGASGSGAPGSSGSASAARLPLKRTNDQPQINTSVAATDKVAKDLGMSRGAVKKRPAPRPPAVPQPDPRRDMAYYSALSRQQDEERRRLEQTAINLAQGLPPVLSAAAKLERLRKMDALHNRETSPPARPPGLAPLNAADPRRRLNPSPEERDRDRRHEFRNLKPMTPDEFMRRFNALQLSNGPRLPGAEGGLGAAGGGGSGAGAGGNARGNDRFSEIKSSLRELRRGLNEVTAPYNSNCNNMEIPTERDGRLAGGAGGRRSSSPERSASEDEDDVRLPCEFCGRAVPVHDLVRHQTGCRPDLAQFRVPRRSRQQRQNEEQLQRMIRDHLDLASPTSRAPPSLRPDPEELPVIPCEFCTESLPVYLIQDHQERCRRDGPMLFPD